MINIIIKCSECGKDLACSDYTMTFLGEIIVMVNTDCVCGDCSEVRKLQKEVENLKIN